VESSQQAQDEWVRIIRETSIIDRNFWRECTPGYYNNEGEEVLRSHLGEPYGPGFYAFGRLLQEWRDQGDIWRASSSGSDLQKQGGRDLSPPAL
jgi:cyclohexanone monooxygenase